jgi:hypothetical protein
MGSAAADGSSGPRSARAGHWLGSPRRRRAGSRPEGRLPALGRFVQVVVTRQNVTSLAEVVEDDRAETPRVAVLKDERVHIPVAFLTGSRVYVLHRYLLNEWCRKVDRLRKRSLAQAARSIFSRFFKWSGGTSNHVMLPLR